MHIGGRMGHISRSQEGSSSRKAGGKFYSTAKSDSATVLLFFFFLLLFSCPSRLFRSLLLAEGLKGGRTRVCPKVPSVFGFSTSSCLPAADRNTFFARAPQEKKKKKTTNFMERSSAFQHAAVYVSSILSVDTLSVLLPNYRIRYE